MATEKVVSMHQHKSTFPDLLLFVIHQENRTTVPPRWNSSGKFQTLCHTMISFNQTEKNRYQVLVGMFYFTFFSISLFHDGTYFNRQQIELFGDSLIACNNKR